MKNHYRLLKCLNIAACDCCLKQNDFSYPKILLKIFSEYADSISDCKRHQNVCQISM